MLDGGLEPRNLIFVRLSVVKTSWRVVGAVNRCFLTLVAFQTSTSTLLL